jgi:hypothetical protein
MTATSSIEVKDSPQTEEVEQKPRPVAVTQSSRLSSFKEVLSWRNYPVFLITSWVSSGFIVLNSYMPLYLYTIGWDLLFIGTATGIVSLVGAVCRALGGYIGDTIDRKISAVVVMAPVALYFLIIGLSRETFLIMTAMLLYAGADIARSGSTAYILDTVKTERSGFALALFTAGSILGVPVLLLLGVFTLTVGFTTAIQQMHLMGGFLLLLCAVARMRLDPSPRRRSQRVGSLLRTFLSENARAARLLMVSVPGLVGVVVCDAISDGLFRLGALIYASEVLGVGIMGINLTMLFYLVISFPLLLKIGHVSDTSGIRRAGLIVYTMMPVSALLLLVAPVFPLWGPPQLGALLESVYPGLGTLMTTAFVAIVLKYTNDLLWWNVIISFVQKNLPSSDSAKGLTVFWVIVVFLASVAPVAGGYIYTFLGPYWLFLAILVLNLGIITSISRSGWGKAVVKSVTD